MPNISIKFFCRYLTYLLDLPLPNFFHVYRKVHKAAKSKYVDYFFKKNIILVRKIPNETDFPKLVLDYKIDIKAEMTESENYINK